MIGEFAIERTLLMGVFAIPKRFTQLKLQRQHLGELHLSPSRLLLQIARDQSVIARGMLKDFHCQFTTERRCGRIGLQGIQHPRIIGRINHDQYILMILGG